MSALLQQAFRDPCAVARQDAAPPRVGDAASSRVPSAFLPPGDAFRGLSTNFRRRTLRNLRKELSCHALRFPA